MIISGINRFSVVNYPGKVSCVLFTKDAHFTVLTAIIEHYFLNQKLNGKI